MDKWIFELKAASVHDQRYGIYHPDVYLQKYHLDEMSALLLPPKRHFAV